MGKQKGASRIRNTPFCWKCSPINRSFFSFHFRIFDRIQPLLVGRAVFDALPRAGIGGRRRLNNCPIGFAAASAGRLPGSASARCSGSVFIAFGCGHFPGFAAFRRCCSPGIRQCGSGIGRPLQRRNRPDRYGGCWHGIGRRHGGLRGVFAVAGASRRAREGERDGGGQQIIAPRFFHWRPVCCR